MKKEHRKKTHSAFGRHKLLLCMVVAATALELSVSVWAIHMVRKQTAQNASVMVQNRMEQVENNFFILNQHLKQTLVTQGQGTALSQAQSEDSLTRIQARQTLIDSLIYISGNSGNDYSLFYYFPKSREFLTAVHSRYIAYPQREGLQDAVIQLLDSGYHPSSVSDQWTLLPVVDTYYAIRLYQYQYVWNGSCIPAEALIKPLVGIYPKSVSFPVLFTENGKLAAGAGNLSREGLSPDKALAGRGPFWHKGQRWLVVDSSVSDTGFQLKLFIKDYGQFEKAVLFQTGVLVIIVILLSAVILAMSYTQKKILRPLRLFTERLKSYDPDKPVLIEMSSELEELSAASRQFNNLTKEINRLRIRAYEQELERQKIQMDYMQMQIKPHFFLNSLNLIHSMASHGNCQDVARLSEITASYLRYIFQSDVSCVELGQELNHLRDYLSIMEIRYPDHFQYEIFAEEEALLQAVPPLLLQTFVENSVKHGITADTKMELSISALIECTETSGQKEMLTIFITDNGPGYPQTCLDVWAQGKDLARSGGSHIGIANASKRLKLFYHENAVMKLYNSPLGGAVTELHLPCKEEQNEFTAG